MLKSAIDYLRDRTALRFCVAALLAVPLLWLAFSGLWSSFTWEFLWRAVMIYASLVALNFGLIVISFALYPSEADLDKMFDWSKRGSRIE